MSLLSAPLVHGSVCAAHVIAASRLGAYLLVEDQVLPLLLPQALALPTAVRLADRRSELPLAVGDVAEVGAGRIRTPGLEVEVVRTFRPARVRVREVPGARLAVTFSRLGLGPGLTPETDDEIAGRLLVAAALGAEVESPGARHLAAHLHRTTALSASLLLAAEQGYAVPTVVEYVDAVVAADTAAAARLRPQIEAIGHTSGRALLRGIDGAITEFTEAIPHRRVA